MNRSFSRSRRHFLAALGAATLTSLQASWARADEPAANGSRAPTTRGPLRFLGVFTPHGRAHEFWKPGPNFDLKYPGCSLSVFDDPEQFGYSFRDRLLVCDGVDLAAGIEVGTVGHDASRVILTGSGANGKNASLDQFLAVEQGLGAITPHTSLVLGVGSEGTEIGNNISYAAGGTPIAKWIDPAQIFDEVFGAPLTFEQRAQLAERRARGKSVLDVLRADLLGLRARVPHADVVKLDQHTTALREIEKRLLREPVECGGVRRPDAARFPKVRAYGGGERYFDAITDLEIDLLARAMACDIARFATFYLADLSRTQMFADLPNDVHTEVAHRYSARTSRRPGDPETWQLLARQNQYSYGKVARLMQRLEEAGVLDDTILYVSSDMGDPALHSSRNVPTLIAGGCGGHFRLGRYLDVSELPANTDRLFPNNRLLVSICNAFGVETSHFGHSTNPSTVQGRLEELHVS